VEQLNEHTKNLLSTHLAWVLAINRTHNLTAITDKDAAWHLHVVDSMQALPHVNNAPEGLLLDIGTGAGFPGVPLGILSGRNTLCLDSVKKKAEALESFLRSTEGFESIEAKGMRAEELAQIAPQEFAVVTARAVAPLNSLVELVSPLLHMGGICVLMKGKLSEEELRDGDVAAARCGLVRKQIRNYTLPNGDEQRCIVEYEKAAEPEILLPRRVGVAQKRPLT